MSVELMHDQRDLFGVFVFACDVGQKSKPVLLFPCFGNLHQTLARQWFGSDENITGAIQDVFYESWPPKALFQRTAF